MIRVETLMAPDIADGDFLQLASLIRLMLRDKSRDERELAESMRQEWSSYSGPPELQGRRFIVRDSGRIVANADLLPRKMLTSRGRELAAGLCAVISHPDVRGRGFGKAVVRAAFDHVDSGDFSFALFQSRDDARGFYEKLGCHVVYSPVINSRNDEDPEENPFWEEWVMSYSIAEMPDGEIDVLGPGY
jgi:GNAT superfamily N-acetyltransferase